MEDNMIAVSFFLNLYFYVSHSLEHGFFFVGIVGIFPPRKGDASATIRVVYKMRVP